MKALTLVPGRQDSAELSELDDPPAAEGALLCAPLAVGVCGTDKEILRGLYGTPPPGEERLVLGHECAARVLEPAAGFRAGDVVVPIVRRPGRNPCVCCRAGEWDMCRDGNFTERGITGEHGFARERFRADPESVVKADPALGDLNALLEPASVVAKAWEQIERIASRGCGHHRRVLVTGAGPIGLLAALLSRQRGLETHVVDRAVDGPKPVLVKQLGAFFHPDVASVRKACGSFEVALECTGAPQLVLDLLCATGADSITCLTGVSSGKRVIGFDAAWFNRSLVLENAVVFGTVNANRRHYEQGLSALQAAPRPWLESLVTRRVPLERWREALELRPDDVKVVLVPHA